MALEPVGVAIEAAIEAGIEAGMEAEGKGIDNLRSFLSLRLLLSLLSSPPLSLAHASCPPDTISRHSDAPIHFLAISCTSRYLSTYGGIVRRERAGM